MRVGRPLPDPRNGGGCAMCNLFARGVLVCAVTGNDASRARSQAHPGREVRDAAAGFQDNEDGDGAREPPGDDQSQTRGLRCHLHTHNRTSVPRGREGTSFATAASGVQQLRLGVLKGFVCSI